MSVENAMAPPSFWADAPHLEHVNPEATKLALATWRHHTWELGAAPLEAMQEAIGAYLKGCALVNCFSHLSTPE